MKSRLVAIGMACLLAAVANLTVVQTKNGITLTPLPPADYPNPIGIDWISTSNQLLISTNWNTGNPHNFQTVNRSTGAHAQWGSQAG